jgi:hypothetical protein
MTNFIDKAKELGASDDDISSIELILKDVESYKEDEEILRDYLYDELLNYDVLFGETFITTENGTENDEWIRKSNSWIDFVVDTLGVHF